MNLLRLITFRKGASGGLDPDAAAFLTAIGNTDPTIESAINTLVLDLKGYSIWSKMTAIYPFVGSSASSHSYNLVNPAAFQITWNGTLTHNYDGVTSNGSTGYADTGIIPSTHLLQNDVHISTCTNNVLPQNIFDVGASENGNQDLRLAFSRDYGGTYYWGANQNGWNTISTSPTMLQLVGHQVVSRTGSAGSDNKLYLNGSLKDTGTVASSGLSTKPLYVLAYNFGGTLNGVSTATFNFSSVGAGLNSTEISNFYTAVQNFNLTLAQVTDSDALSFINTAGISNRTQMAAIQQLTANLKSFGLWSKCIAIYPIVGGNVVSHSYNLKNTSQYQITWSGAYTAHTDYGLVGVQGNTNINPSTDLLQDNVHVSAYANIYTAQDTADYGAATSFANAIYFGRSWPSYSNSGISRMCANNTQVSGITISPLTGLTMQDRGSSSSYDIYHNGVSVGNYLETSVSLTSNPFYLNSIAGGGFTSGNNRFCFYSLGTSLSSSEALNLYTAVQAYQTTLGRQA